MWPLCGEYKRLGRRIKKPRQPRSHLSYKTSTAAHHSLTTLENMDGANVGIIDKGVAEHREEGKFPDMVEKGGVVEEPKVYDKDFMQKTRYKVN